MAKAKKNRSSDFPDYLNSQDQTEQGGSPDPMTGLDGGDDDEDSDADLEKVGELLQIFGAKLGAKRDEWVNARSATGVEQRFVSDVDQFNGKDRSGKATSHMMDSVEQGYPVTVNHAKATRSNIFVQVTRQRTNMSVARLGDVTLPDGEQNFSVRPASLPRLPSFVTVPGTSPTPVAQASAQAGAAPAGPVTTAQMPGAVTQTSGSMAGSTGMQAPTGQPQSEGAGGTPGIVNPPPVSPDDPDAQMKLEVLAQMAIATERAEAMATEITDCFEECDFTAEQRKCQFNMGLFGTGVLKGPIAIKSTKKVWARRTDGAGKPFWILDIQTDLTPHSFSIDPRNVFPDPSCGENVQDGRGLFELERLSPKQVRELAQQPEYLKKQLIQVLDEGPQVGKAITAVDHDNGDLVPDDIYEHWIYWGEIDRDDLVAAGAMEEAAEDESDDDKLKVVSACVEMINTTVVRAYINPYPDNCLPYDMIAWERIPGMVWGYGVPYLMRAQQRVINTAWRMILDNAGVSAGPQIVVKPKMIQPADKQWTITSRKIWYAKDEVDDVKSAFATFEFNMHLDELSKILDLASNFIDQETATPSLVQGAQDATSMPQKGQVPLQLVNANVVLKQRVKQYDDYGIKPHVRRYYDFLMEYSDKEEIKGAFNIVALGSSSLMSRDLENQAITNLLAMASNPAYAVFINRQKLFTKALKAQHIEPLDVMNSDAEIQAAIKAQAQQQQPDPRIEAAQIIAKSKTDALGVQQQIAQQTLQQKAEQAASDREMRIQELMIERDIEILRAAQQEKTTVAQVKSDLAAVAIKERATTDRQMMKQGHEQTMAGVQGTNDMAQLATTQHATTVRQQMAQDHTSSENDLNRAHTAAVAGFGAAQESSEAAAQRGHESEMAQQAQDAQDAAPPPNQDNPQG